MKDVDSWEIVWNCFHSFFDEGGRGNKSIGSLTNSCDDYSSSEDRMKRRKNVDRWTTTCPLRKRKLWFNHNSHGVGFRRRVKDRERGWVALCGLYGNTFSGWVIEKRRQDECYRVIEEVDDIRVSRSLRLYWLVVLGDKRNRIFMLISFIAWYSFGVHVRRYSVKVGGRIADIAVESGRGREVHEIAISWGQQTNIFLRRRTSAVIPSSKELRQNVPCGNSISITSSCQNSCYRIKNAT